jgi:hypothetical protein
MASFVKHVQVGHNEHNNIDHYAGKYVKAMETRNGEKEIAEVGRRL